MLLAVDAGNTQVVVGLFHPTRGLLQHWRLVTSAERTADEYGVLWHTLLQSVGHRLDEVDGVVVASVVPALTAALGEASRRWIHREAVRVGQASRHDLILQVDRPGEVGADRIANAVAAIAFYGEPVIVVDFGTATTYDAIAPGGVYLGGAISPGIGISSEALFSRAARLPRQDMVFPERTIGRNTRDGLRSGILLGAVAQVEGLVRRIGREMGGDPRVILTGGYAELLAPHLPGTVHDRFLTLEGLRILFERERPSITPP